MSLRVKILVGRSAWSVAVVSIQGLLEYLEDIIGSNRYVEATEAAGREVEQLEEARLEKLNRVKLIEKEKDGLEEAKVEAEVRVSPPCDAHPDHPAVNLTSLSRGVRLWVCGVPSVDRSMHRSAGRPVSGGEGAGAGVAA